MSSLRHDADTDDSAQWAEHVLGRIIRVPLNGGAK